MKDVVEQATVALLFGSRRLYRETDWCALPSYFAQDFC